MSSFTKTIIVDQNHVEVEGEYRQTINAAAYDLRTSGGRIIVEAGTYDIDGTDSNKRTIAVYSNTTIVGNGNVVINVTADVPVFRNFYWDQPDGNHHITISGFKIVESRTASPYKNHLVDFRNVNNCLIEKLTITCEGTQGIYNDYIPPTEQYAAILLYSSGENNTCINNIIRQCYIYDYGKDVGTSPNIAYNYGFGICLSGIACSNNIVKNNYISGCLDGIFLMDTSNNIVTNNIFTSSAGHYPAGVGVLVQNCNSTIISGNQIKDNRDHGIYLSGCKRTVVRGNVVSDNHDHGMHVRFAGTFSVPIKDEYNCIAGNVFYHNDGLHATNPANRGCGIQMQGHADWNSIFGNSCVKNTAIGIRVQVEIDPDDDNPDTNKHPAKNNIVSGNLCCLNDLDDGIQISTEDPSNIDANNKTIQL